MAIGFVLVDGDASLGWSGGLLILGCSGRPEEFHCTVPTRVNRAQQMLYGQTLQSFLWGETIYPALYDQATVKPQLVLTTQLPILAGRRIVDVPLLCCLEPDGDLSFAESTLGDCGEVPVVTNGHDADLDDARSTLARRSWDWDLYEPFERVQEALSELAHTAIPARDAA